MPPQLGQLTELVVLTDFVIGRGKSCSIAELGALEHLKGELCIWNLENVDDPSHATGANLKGKRYIEKLEFRWGDDGYNRSLPEQILEQLRPSTYLKALQLEALKELAIECFDSIVRVGPELCGNSGNKRAFPSLENLGIGRCEKIRSFEFGLTKNLRSLDVRYCPVFESLYCGDEEGPLTSLHSLTISHCSDFISFPGQGLQAPNLKKLSLQYLDALEGLPKHMHSLLPSLKQLTLVVCTKLRSFPEGGLPSSIEKLEIWWCDGIESSPEGGFPSNLKELKIVNCSKLVADRRNWGLQALQSLSSLHIDGCGEVLESFPEETLLPPSLNSLWLRGFKHLKSLHYKGLEHLSSLNELQLSWCPELQSMPEEGLPSPLQYLELNGCPNTLEERYQENGGDWHKISHIPWIRINGKEIKPRQSTLSSS
ncbi:hypothetical protein Tsubulata_034807, partial [Turnera subulata]